MFLDTPETRVRSYYHTRLPDLHDRNSPVDQGLGQETAVNFTTIQVTHMKPTHAMPPRTYSINTQTFICGDGAPGKSDNTTLVLRQG